MHPFHKSLSNWIRNLDPGTYELSAFPVDGPLDTVQSPNLGEEDRLYQILVLSVYRLIGHSRYQARRSQGLNDPESAARHESNAVEAEKVLSMLRASKSFDEDAIRKMSGDER